MIADENTPTPGPWTWSDKEDDPYAFTMSNGYRCVDMRYSGSSTSEAIANARLIAAAPTLLETLAKVCAQLRKRECSIADCKALDAADAAITKATGETK